MYNEIKKILNSLNEPTIWKLKTFDELLEENIKEAKEILSSDEVEWNPIDSDPYMKKLRVLTLRQIHNQNYMKSSIKKMLITTATEVDLDHLGIEKNVIRDKGHYPYADFEFKLSEENKNNVVIPEGLVLNSTDDRFKAHTIKQTTIPAGELTAVVRVELEEYTKESFVKTEKLLTDVPFSLEIKQLENFKNGESVETDERYRLRILSANAKYNTAGSLEAYKFFTYSADGRIKDVSIPTNNKQVLDVDIYIASDAEIDDEMIQKVYDSCNKKFVRPLGDRLNVYPAELILLDLVAEIELFELYDVDEIDAQIKENFNLSFFIGDEFLRVDFIKKFHVTNNVYKVNSEFEDTIVTNKQIIKINSINFTYVQAKEI